jgi:GTP-binding protein
VDVSGASGRDPVSDFDVIGRELALFSPDVAVKPQIVAATKIDVLQSADVVSELEAHVRAAGYAFHRISAVTGEGLAGLLEDVWQAIAHARVIASPAEAGEDEEESPDLLSSARSRRDP